VDDGGVIGALVVVDELTTVMGDVGLVIVG